MEPTITQAPSRGVPPATERAVMALPVGEVMRTGVAAVAAEETVLVAWELLERTGVSHLPVVLPDGRCSGLLTRSDVAVACCAPAAVLSTQDVHTLLSGRRTAAVRVDMSVRKAAATMTDNECDAVPVLGESGRLVGLLTASDVVAAFVRHPPALAPRDIGEQPVTPLSMTPGREPRHDERTSPVP
ncbi:CBS domain-containing protein [Streptomyces sp. NPDC002004]